MMPSPASPTVMLAPPFAHFFATGLIGLTGNNNRPALYVMFCLCLTLRSLVMVKEIGGATPRLTRWPRG